MFMFDLHKVSWWYWLATAALLSWGLTGNSTGFVLAIGLTVIQLIHFILRERRLNAFPVQLRMGYLMLLVLALPPSMQWLYWLPGIGTWAQVLFGYCLLARTLTLLPWNRSVPLSTSLLRRTFLARPVRGSILQALHAR